VAPSVPVASAEAVLSVTEITDGIQNLSDVDTHYTDKKCYDRNRRAQ